MKTYTINVYGIEEYLFDTRKAMWKTISVNDSNNVIYPLKWYIGTGRASLEFLRKMVQVKPFVMARFLLKIQDNSVDAAVDLIKRKIGYIES